MNILEGLFFGSQAPFDEVDVNCSEYYRAGDKVEQVKAKILERYPELAQLMEEYHNAQMEQASLGTYHHFSVGVRVGAQLMLEMLKEL
ncbi:MAG: hypothetical protein NC299_17595 [Lachnospiraceae bacterium]|nr:hypothetical protein [Ruminococcus sp.]MCM1277147.1 hypothetical protein [Lachnospiraceae bacterium]